MKVVVPMLIHNFFAVYYFNNDIMMKAVVPVLAVLVDSSLLMYIISLMTIAHDFKAVVPVL